MSRTFQRDYNCLNKKIAFSKCKYSSMYKIHTKYSPFGQIQPIFPNSTHLAKYNTFDQNTTKFAQIQPFWQNTTDLVKYNHLHKYNHFALIQQFLAKNNPFWPNTSHLVKYNLFRPNTTILPK